MRLATVALLLALAISRPAAPHAQAQAQTRTVTFGALLNSSPLGDVDTQAAVRIAVEDVNDYLAAGGSALRIQVQVEGTGLQPVEALQKVVALADRGVNVIVGPESSGELAAILPIARQRDLVLLSHCSTAPSLAIPDDPAFRLLPDDSRQAQALAQLMWEDGVRVVVPIWRDDVFGTDLSAAVKRDFAALGGAVREGVRFDPGGKQFTAELAALEGQAAEAATEYGPGAVGIQLVAFGPDGVPILRQAAASALLGQVRWYGTEGTAHSREILADDQATRFAIRVGFPNSIYAEPETAQSAQLMGRIAERIGNDEVHVCALAAYDAVWLATLTTLVGGTDRDSAAFKRALGTTAAHYVGPSGWTALNAAGDREAADYDFWVVREFDGQPRWERVARYAGATGRLER